MTISTVSWNSGVTDMENKELLPKTDDPLVILTDFENEVGWTSISITPETDPVGQGLVSEALRKLF